MAESTSKPALDHIVLLLPLAVLQNLPSWLTDHLTITPGGRHADGVTENKLILFEDGVYIELIAFSDPASVDNSPRLKHRWGRQPEGHIIDWALTLPVPDGGDDGPAARFAEVQDRVRQAGTDYFYADPVAGGRKRPDGVEVRWSVATARRQDERAALKGQTLPVVGELPFWCLDRTPRDLRVPLSERPEAARHACGAVGVASVTVAVRGINDSAAAAADRVRELEKVYDAMLGERAKLVAVEPAIPGYSWRLRVPVPRPGGPEPRLTLRGWTEEGIHNVKELVEEAEAGVHISIALFTKGPSSGRRLEGRIGRGKKLTIDLVPLA